MWCPTAGLLLDSPTGIRISEATSAARFITKCPQQLYENLRRELNLTKAMHRSRVMDSASVKHDIKRRRDSPELFSSNDPQSTSTTVVSHSGNELEDEKVEVHIPEKVAVLQGEHRLIITFEDYGAMGAHPQTLGRDSNIFIPDGLSGYHTVYQERWRFEVKHCLPDEQNITRVTWTIQNLNSRGISSRTETKDEARTRVTKGRTIANQVFREAMDKRANELEQWSQLESNETRKAHLLSLVRNLRPKRFTSGPLVFGLQHQFVQDKINVNSIA